MMRIFGLVFAFSMLLPALVSAEFYSDVDSKESDEAKALEIKAKDFWQGLMDSAQGLETTRNAELSARLELSLKTLPAEHNDIRELFNEAVGHLANADSMLFEEASRSKMMALQRLENGPSHEVLHDYVSEWEDVLVTAYAHFVGHRSYEKKLAQHILSRLKEVDSALVRAADMAPQMYEESEKASKCALDVFNLLNSDLDNGNRKEALRALALDIIRATGKQRMRFQDYLYGSLLTTAQDMAGEKEKASRTVMKASLRGLHLPKGPSKPFDQLRAIWNDDEKKTAASPASVGKLPPLMFFDGVPADAKPIVHVL